jgi:hypothetical protein
MTELKEMILSGHKADIISKSQNNILFVPDFGESMQ